MSVQEPNSIEVLLRRIREGDSSATSQLLEIAYGELRRLAHQEHGRNSNQNTLQPTAMVNEVCMKLIKTPNPDWQDQVHFFRVAATAMRNLLIDRARAKRAEKRGGNAERVMIEADAIAAKSELVDLVELDDSLTKLAAMDNRLAQIFELRFLVGLSVERTGQVLGVSPRTIELDTRLLRAWMQKEMSG
jgi:RNA polymerase sigma factor (TIGR02999 family)